MLIVEDHTLDCEMYNYNKTTVPYINLYLSVIFDSL
jgi:hypothetical protein